MSSFLFQNTIQLTLLGIHQCLLGMHQCSYVIPQTIVLTIAVKVLGMLHYIPSHCIQVDIERPFIQSSCQIEQLLRSKNETKR